jgi:integrase
MKKVRTHVHKRKYDSGKTVWMVRWWDHSAHKWRGLKGGATRDEAEATETRLRDDLLRGINPAAWIHETPAESVSELIDIFYQSPHYQSVGESWRQIMRYHFEGLIKSKLGGLQFSEVTRDKLYAFYLEIKNKHNLSNSSIQKYHLKLCFLGDIYLERHPDKINVPRQLKDFKKRFPREAPRREINFLTPEEIEKVLNELKNTTSDLAYPFTKLLVHTGMRRNEARNLKWTDVDYESGFIHIRKSKNGKSRSVPIEPGAQEAIEMMHKKSEYIFVHENGARPDQHSLRRPFQRAAKRIGIDKRVDLHSLRHSYGSNKIRAGWGLKKVSLLLGHSDISLTARVYTHLLDGDLKVQDDFRFDNSREKKNSVRNSGDVGNFVNGMDTATIMAMIQMLQQQLSQAQSGNIAEVSTNKITFSQNKSEEFRKSPLASTIASEMTPICNAGVTGQKKGRIKAQQNFSKKSKLPFKINNINLVGVARFELTTPCSQSKCASQAAPHPDLRQATGY